MLTNYSLEFPRAFGDLTAKANFRECPEDFQVNEELGFEPCGSGEHVYLHVCKRGENTAWVAERIAAIANVKLNDVGYCGRKDRHAVTSQWFSIYLPKGVEPAWSLLISESIKILAVTRHQHKLRRGDHQQNHFSIRLRNVATHSTTFLEQKIERIFAQGVPNYFGDQRFGRNGSNLCEAQEMLVNGKRYRDQQKRGLILSAARSYLFNHVLAARVVAGNWAEQLEGESEPFSSGPLWGRGRSLVSGALAELEQQVLSDWKEWCDGLEHVGLLQERRALQLIPRNASYHWDEPHLVLHFSLGAGEFATAILREVADLLISDLGLA